MTPRMTTMHAFLLVTLGLLLAGPAQAQTTETTPARTQIEWLAGAITTDPVRFADDLHARCTDEFARAVPKRMLVAQFTQLQLVLLGAGPVTIERYDTPETDTSATALIRSSQTGVPMRLSVVTTPDGERIAGLNINRVGVGGKLGVQSWDDLDEHLATLQGKVSLTAMDVEDETLLTIHAYRPAERLAIGSTFKLYVLGALAERIAAGDAAWNEPLAIDDDLKSLPSGVMQNEPAGTTHPLSHYAAQMIAISDNTATDHLIHRVGRERVEAFMYPLQTSPQKSLPFLTTMEMFTIKLSGDDDLAETYANATIDRRRAMLEEDGPVDQASPDLASARNWSTPTLIDQVEWFATTPELCRVMSVLHQLELRHNMTPLSEALRRNPGLPTMHADWPSVAYKGGSEPGVLNMTWLLTRDDGRLFALSISWNDPTAQVDETAMLDIAAEAFSLLHQHDR